VAGSFTLTIVASMLGLMIQFFEIEREGQAS